MKKIIGLIVTCLWLGVGFSQSAQSTGEKLENEFSKEVLTSENLAAFEFRAKQKVIDFCNYIQLISSKEYDQSFREYAKTTAGELFYANTCLIKDSLINGGTNTLKIGDYLAKVYESEYYQILCEASNLVLAEKLKQISPDHFTGLITYTQTTQCLTDKGEITYSSRKNKTVGVSLSRQSKAFGSTEKLIWVVSLCDVD